MLKIYVITAFLTLPYFLQAQCTATQQAILSDREGILSDAEGLLIDEKATTYEIPCKASKAILYPNPCLDNFQIKGLDKAYTEGFIFSIDGRFYFNVNVQREIDVSSLGQGLYVLKIKNSSLFFKFVKK
jgi:hypothetical protein